MTLVHNGAGLLVTGGLDGVIREWDETGECRGEIVVGTGVVKICVLPDDGDGEALMVITQSGAMQCWKCREADDQWILSDASQGGDLNLQGVITEGGLPMSLGVKRLLEQRRETTKNRLTRKSFWHEQIRLASANDEKFEKLSPLMAAANEGEVKRVKALIVAGST